MSIVDDAIKDQNLEISGINDIFDNINKTMLVVNMILDELKNSNVGVNLKRDNLSSCMKSLNIVVDKNVKDSKQSICSLQTQDKLLKKALRDSSGISDLANDLKDKALELKMIEDIRSMLNILDETDESNEVLRKICKDLNFFAAIN